MGNIKSYKDLIIWQKAIDLSVEIYNLTSIFPREELYGLTSQLRRAVNSVSLNIAEGYGKNTTKNYINSLYIAQGSLREVESGIILAVKLGFLKEQICSNADALIIELLKMFNALISTLERKIKTQNLVYEDGTLYPES